MVKPHERRKYRRLRAYHLVKYRPAFAQDKPLVLASIKDISAGGVCLVTKENLPTGSLLQVFINFLWLPAPVPVLAKVVWIKKPGRKQRFECGLEFSEIEEVLRKDIHGRITNVR
jgi:c-di-GMP-binding flagellar brake protein YcgR